MTSLNLFSFSAFLRRKLFSGFEDVPCFLLSAPANHMLVLMLFLESLISNILSNFLVFVYCY